MVHCYRCFMLQLYFYSLMWGEMSVFCASMQSFTLKIACLFPPPYGKHKTCNFLLSAGKSIVGDRVGGVYVFVGLFFVVHILLLNSFLLVEIHFLCVSRKGFRSPIH